MQQGCVVLLCLAEAVLLTLYMIMLVFGWSDLGAGWFVGVAVLIADVNTALWKRSSPKTVAAPKNCAERRKQCACLDRFGLLPANVDQPLQGVNPGTLTSEMADVQHWDA